LLIVWGGLRLLEILVWTATSKPLPRQGVSGGEWILIIFICLFGAGLYTAHNYTGWWPGRGPLRGLVIDMGETYDYDLGPAQQSSGKSPHVVIESFRGNAKISGDPNATTVAVTGHKTIRSLQRRDADEANTETPVVLVQNGDQIIVRTGQNRVSDRLRVSEDLEITVPKGASIEGHGRNGDFDIDNVDGAVDVESDNAGVRVQNIGGNVRVQTQKSDVIRAVGVKGNVDLKGRGSDVELRDVAGLVTIDGIYTGDIRFQNLAKPVHFTGTQTEFQAQAVPGQIDMTPGDFTGNGITGPVQINGRSRDVTMSDFTQALNITLDRGDITLRPSATSFPKLDVRTHSGDLELALPTAAKFDLRAETGHGDIENDWGSPLNTQNSGHGGIISGTIGGGPSLRLNTDRGTITVRKATVEDADALPKPEPPKPPKPPKGVTVETE
ncbi:MAG: DUF4097 family beta strand repeat-containing protein, partial [Terriglobia bacterium]